MQDLKLYASPKAKLTRLKQAGQLIQIRRGLFISPEDQPSPRVLSSIIYGPSYLSFQFALSVHGLIPEGVKVYTSASFHKNKQKVYHTPLGDYYYYSLPPNVYPYGIQLEEENGSQYIIASPEKAICDSLYKVHRKAGKIDIGKLLLEDWRVEKENLLSLDLDFISFLVPLYHKRLLLSFAEWLKNEAIHA